MKIVHDRVHEHEHAPFSYLQVVM